MKIILYIIFFLTFLTNSFAYDWSEVRQVINEGIKEKTLPGGVLLIGDKNQILFHEAFGNGNSEYEVNTTDTLYDIASLTKVVATTTSIMILVEQGKLSLQDKVSKFYPDFIGYQKNNVTIEKLLRHQSGLGAGLVSHKNESLKAYVERFLSLPLSYFPGKNTVYSDLGFILLGQIVEKISSQSIDKFAFEKIFKPLEMESTTFHVPSKSINLCALTRINQDACTLHDPVASSFLPDVSGNAGVFSTAGNLSHLFKMYLNMGQYKNKQFLKTETIKKMTTITSDQVRGLGLDLLSPYAKSPRGEYYPAGVSYGHTGYTGTTAWVDPISGSYFIFLSNRVLLGEAETAKKFSKLRFDMSSVIGKQFYPY